ncbi:vWA domain-containing protein [Actinacidiphila acidipaludis]|uniref:VWFA domain-containing protein n=1 Tax=Actinacidiphila acidipaludis TaxID=2873382 RepID=A0ABS7QF81_9ACTN|nr:hypothetical protein [Streptomyces acidipaludis]MBY8881359.1 hypothetical protein [Streptomyces acidipaludis]
MTAPLPLISSVDRVPRERYREWWDEHRNVAIVHRAPDGTLTVGTSATPSFWEKVLGKAGVRLAVDVSDHRRQAAVTRTPLPCSDQAHRFTARFDVGFRVHDPANVVSRNIPDALPVVYGHVVHQIRTIARAFPIDEADRAEEAVNRAFQNEVRLPEGITIYLCQIHIEPDEAATEYIKALRAAQRNRTLGQHRHDSAVAGARSEQAIEDIKLDGELARDQRRGTALAGMSWDIEGLIRQHLIKHPEDTDRAMQLRIEWETGQAARWELGVERNEQMFKFLVDKDFFRPADVAALYGGGGGGGSPWTAPPGLPPTADATAPVPTAPVLWGNLTPGGAGSAPSIQAKPAVVVPVYVLLDVSQAAAHFIAGFNDALRSLHTALAQSPDLATGLRLSVVGIAERPDMRLPLTQVGWGTDVPHLSAGGGLKLAAAFDGLLDLLPGDVDGLKKGGGRAHRPVVFLVTVAPPQDGVAWPQAQQRLAEHRYAPKIVACGLGESDPRTVLRCASSSELACVAAPGTGVPEQTVALSALLQNTVLHLGRGVLAGHPDLVTEYPQGLGPATAS